MPVYEYVCRSCKHEFEELARSMQQPEPVRCPDCNSRSVERKLSVFAARQGETAVPSTPGGCGRCGDPQGPCGI